MWVGALVALALCAAPAAAQEEAGGEEERLPAPELKFGGRVFARAEASSLDDYTRKLTLPSARLSLQSKWKGALQVEVDAELTSSSPLRDALVELKLGKGFTLDAGRFKAPFSERQLVSRWKLQLFDRGLVNEAIDAAGFVGRRIGLQLGWRPTFFPRLDLEVGAFSGNEGEDLVARARVKVGEFVRLGGAVYSQSGGGLAWGANLNAAHSGFELKLEGLLWPQPLTSARAAGATALLLRRFALSGDFWLAPLVGLEGLRVEGVDPARSLVAGVNGGRGDAVQVQLQLFTGQPALGQQSENRVVAQVGARF